MMSPYSFCVVKDESWIERTITAAGHSWSGGWVASLGAGGKLAGVLLIVCSGCDAGIAVADEWLASVEPESTEAASGVRAGGLGLVRAGHETVTFPVVGEIGEYVPTGLFCGSSLTHSSPLSLVKVYLNSVPVESSRS